MKNKYLIKILFVILGIFINNAYSIEKKLFVEVINNRNIDNFFLSKSDEDIFKKIKQNIKNNNWLEAYKLEKKITSQSYQEAINVYITLHKFKNLTNMNIQEIYGLIEFNTEYYFLDEFELFNTKIEYYYLDNVIRYEDVYKYFNKFQSKNLSVLIKLLKEESNFINEQNKNDDEKLKTQLLKLNNKIRYYWVNNKMTSQQQKVFYETFDEVLTEKDLIERIEMLAFKKEYSNMESLIQEIKTNKMYIILFKGIIEIGKMPVYINHILRNIPKELRDNEALAYTKVLYYRKYKDDDKIIDIILNLKSSKRYASYWFNYRNIMTRNLMKDKKYKKAYAIISDYNGTNNIDYTDSEFMAGWLAFRYLNNKELALKHFKNLYNNVSYPTSVSRASYWLGRLYESIGNKKECLEWYNISEQYSTTFYGQLSHYAKYNILINDGEKYKNIIFPEKPKITEEDIKNIESEKIVKLAILYHQYEGKRKLASKIFDELIGNNKNKGEIAELLEIVTKLDDTNLTARLSKKASYKSVFFMDNLFPLLRMVKRTDQNIALIHSIIKQESGFIVQAESLVGAIGFMQIMPQTAKTLCKELKITYNQYKLRNDPQYNIKLGSYYINQLINQFDGSKIMAIASYNAGPKATNNWVKDFGDPRFGGTMESAVDWIESISYKETRNYVQRILENLVVYEHILGITGNN